MTGLVQKEEDGEMKEAGEQTKDAEDFENK